MSVFAHFRYKVVKLLKRHAAGERVDLLDEGFNCR